MSSGRVLDSAGPDLTAFVDIVRLDAARRLDPKRRAELGQFFTPAPVASLMASLSRVADDHVRLLDAGAGVGMLSAAWVSHACLAGTPPSTIEIVAYELDESLHSTLNNVLENCQSFARDHGSKLIFEIRGEDFIRSGVSALTGGLFGSTWPQFDIAILNPPYKKFRNDSEERRLLREINVEASNLYAAFVALAMRSVRNGGELIAITPRSFCNGPYFTPFRRDLLRLGSLSLLHIFDSRDAAFEGDSVLQENVIFRVERGGQQAPTVTIEWSSAGEVEHTSRREIPFKEVVHAADPDSFIHIVADEWNTRISEIMTGLMGCLEKLDIEVSTGRVVDFRSREYLRSHSGEGTIPLIYPTHFALGKIAWPKAESKKPNAFMLGPATQNLVNPTGVYVLVKRFSAKEERRRVVAAVYSPEKDGGDWVAFENHLNYFHRHGRGLPANLALGLTRFLNSTLVDSYFRQFNGHTQVNATDLRKLNYPTLEQLCRIAERVGDVRLEQSELDELVEGELLNLPEHTIEEGPAQTKIAEASAILKAIGLPKEQTNERAALTLLALLNLKPDRPWSEASNPLRGVTPIMEFVADHYGKQWAPNTRETVRRFTLHQFQDAGLVVANPDKPDRPVNSPAYCYQVPETALNSLREFDTPKWKGSLKRYLESAGTLAAKYASERQMARIPLRIREGEEITLSPGGQNDLIRSVVENFCPRFTPDGALLYVGDADDKWGYVDRAALKALGINVDSHGKMPDVVVHYTAKNWLVLIEAVTSHGPVNAKRRGELKALFAASSAALVYVTAFLTRQALNRYLAEIAWETEVWVAEAPTHLIHFNGERFLGPYDA